MNKNDLLKWENGFKAAREMECRLIRKQPLNQERSIRLALLLVDLCRQQGVWPIRDSQNQVREREVNIVRDRWKILKKAVKSD
ncbi:MAG: hypothetical protein AAB019_08380 [Planctomycetota bacterium]